MSVSLVTGAAGYLGSHLVRALLARGDRVHVLDLKPCFEEDPRVLCFQGDLRDRRLVHEACRGVEAVFHTASVISTFGLARPSLRKQVHGINVQGTQNLIAACQAKRVPRLVYTSSVNVVFDGPIERGDESLPYPKRFPDLYGETKALAEQAVLAANGVRGVSTCALRPGGIYGPGEASFLPKLVERYAFRRNGAVVGGGSARADNIYIDDLVRAHLLAAKKLEPASPVAGQAYFINDGEAHNYFEFFAMILAGLGFEVPRWRVPVPLAHAYAFSAEALFYLLGRPRPLMNKGEVMKVAVNHNFRIDKARRELGFEPQVSTEMGVQRVLPYCKELLRQLQESA